jgi:hypothetical protein
VKTTKQNKEAKKKSIKKKIKERKKVFQNPGLHIQYTLIFG